MARLFYGGLTEENAKDYLNDASTIPPYTASCYYLYNHHMCGDGLSMYFGFYADEKIINLIKEINDNFENIKIKIVGMKEFSFRTDAGFFDKNGFYFSIPDNYTWILFKVELDSGYSEKSKFVLQLTMAEFLRGFCPEFEHHILSSKIENNYIDGMLEAQGYGNYGCWLCCSYDRYYKCDRKVFDKLDDIELVNNFTVNVDYGDMPSISNLIDNLRNTMKL